MVLITLMGTLKGYVCYANRNHWCSVFGGLRIRAMHEVSTKQHAANLRTTGCCNPVKEGKLWPQTVYTLLSRLFAQCRIKSRQVASLSGQAQMPPWYLTMSIYPSLVFSPYPNSAGLGSVHRVDHLQIIVLPKRICNAVCVEYKNAILDH